MVKGSGEKMLENVVTTFVIKKKKHSQYFFYNDMLKYMLQPII